MSSKQTVPEELKDFRNFLYLVWKHLNLPDPTPIQYEIAEWMQNGLEEPSSKASGEWVNLGFARRM